MVALGLLGAAGCGRIDFDAVPADASLDASADQALPAIEVTGATISDGTPASMLAITRVPSGHAVLWIGAPPSYAYGFIVGPSGAALRTDAPLVTPEVGSSYGYDRITLSTRGSVIVGAAQVTDGTMYLKTFLDDLSDWATADLHSGTIARPAYGDAGSTSLAVFNDNGLVAAVRIDANGFEILPSTPLAVGTTGWLSSTSLAGAFAVAAEVTLGSCQVLIVSPTLTAAPSAEQYAPCQRPFIGSRGDASAVIAYESGSTVQVAKLNTQPSRTITGSDPRVATLDSGECVTYLNGGIYVEPISGPNAGARGVVTGVPAGDPDAYEVEGDTGFAMYGNRLFRFSACF